MKGTKSRLIVSILLIIGCLALTVGASFAWFTDSITNSGNKIQAGTLSADLIMYDGTEYISIADRTGSIFNETTVWEPGYTHVVYLGVRNTGSLALKYNIILNITDGGLVGALEYALIDGVTAEDLSSVTNWEDFKAQSGAQTGKIMAGKMTVAPNGTLDEVASGVQNETDYFAVAVHMLEGSGNDYQGKSVDIDVTVPIKQASAEEDGFGDPDYDSGAEFPVTTEVSSAAEFKAALSSAAPVNIIVTQNISSLGTISISGDVTIDLTKMPQENDKGINGEQITIENGGKLTVNGSWVLYGRVSAFAIKHVNITGEGSSVTFNNVYFGAMSSADKTAITVGTGSELVINGGYYSTSGNNSTVILANGGTIEITGGNFSNAGSQGAVFAVTDGGKIVIEKSIYENNVKPTSGQKIASDCIATLEGDNYIISQK